MHTEHTCAPYRTICARVLVPMLNSNLYLQSGERDKLHAASEQAQRGKTQKNGSH